MVVRSKSIVVAALAVMMVGVLGLTACGGSSAPAGGSAGQAAKDCYVVSKVERNTSSLPSTVVNTLDSRGAVTESSNVMKSDGFESEFLYKYTLDKNGIPVSTELIVKNNGEVTQTDSYTSEVTVNAKGLPEKVVISKGNETTYTYDANGNLESIENKGANGSTISTFNADGYLVKRESISSNGANTMSVVSEYTFENGKPVSYSYTDPNSTREYRVECDDNGNIVALYQGDEKVASLEYVKVSNAYPYVAATSRGITI